MSVAVRAFLNSLHGRGIAVRRKPAGDRLGRLKCIGRLHFSPASLLTAMDHDFIRGHLAELLAAVSEQSAPPSSPEPAPERPPSKSGQRRLAENGERELSHRESQPRPSPARSTSSKPAAERPARTEEPTPALSVRGHGRIDEEMVLEMLRDLGDEPLADYRAGRLSKGKAYAMAADYVQARLDLGWTRLGTRWVERSELPVEWFLRERES